MTTTSAGPHGFHVKPLVTVFAVAAIAAATIFVAQQVGSDSPQSVPKPIEASAEATAPVVNPYRLSDALADGKLDAGLIPAPSQAATGSVPVPELVPLSGQGGLYEALLDGKFALDFASGDPGVQYVRSPETATSESGLWGAFAEGKLDTGLGDSEPATQPSPAASYTPTLSGGHQQ